MVLHKLCVDRVPLDIRRRRRIITSKCRSVVTCPLGHPVLMLIYEHRWLQIWRWSSAVHAEMVNDRYRTDVQT